MNNKRKEGKENAFILKDGAKEIRVIVLNLSAEISEGDGHVIPCYFEVRINIESLIIVMNRHIKVAKVLIDNPYITIRFHIRWVAG